MIPSMTMEAEIIPPLDVANEKSEGLATLLKGG